MFRATQNGEFLGIMVTQGYAGSSRFYIGVCRVQGSNTGILAGNGEETVDYHFSRV